MSQHPLSITRRCALLDVPRSSAYYRPVAAVSERDSALMRAMDEIHLRWPFYGSRRICDALADAGYAVNRKCVQRLMRAMGMNALYPGPNTSRAHHAHKVYPYLLRGLAIEGANQVWCADVTYLPMARGFVYLVAVMDWYSRKVLAWRLSNTLDADFCVEALNEALARHGAPEIFNTDQGCLHRRTQSARHPNQHGRQGTLDGQRLHRTPLAQPEIRGSLPACLRQRTRRPRRRAALDGLLQPAAQTSGA